MPVEKPAVLDSSKDGLSLFIVACKYGHGYLVYEQLKGISRLLCLLSFLFFYSLALEFSHSIEYNYSLKLKRQ